MIGFILNVWFIQSCSEQEDAFHFLAVETSKQKQHDRIEIAPISRKVVSLPDFLNPGFVKVSEKGIFVLDWADSNRVKKINWDFEAEHTIGRGVGEGPGEIASVSDMHLPGDTLYFSDPDNGLVHLYTTENEFIKSISLDREIPHRIITNGTQLVSETISTEKLLFFDESGTRLRAGDAITQNATRYRFVFESILFSDGEFIYRLPQYFGLAAKYNKQGELLSVAELIDPGPALFEDHTPDEQNRPIMISRENMNIFSHRASLHKNKLCILRLYFNEEKRIIDCYKTTDLAYLFSFSPPEDLSIRDFQNF